MTDPLAPIVKASISTGALVSVDDPPPLPPRLRASIAHGELVGRDVHYGTRPGRRNATKRAKAAQAAGRVHMTRRGLEPIETGDKAAEDAASDKKPAKGRSK